MMTTEDLMKPRYKVIADYPFNSHAVGDILQESHSGYYKSDKRKEMVSHPQDYPAVFKPLAWWEDREDSELPNYIRLNQIMVVKVAKHHCSRYDEFKAEETGYCYPYGICKPATKSEYLITHSLPNQGQVKYNPHDPLTQRMADTNLVGVGVWIGSDYNFKIDVVWIII